MRNFFLFLIFAFTFSACNNIAGYKETVEAMTSDWKTTAGKIMTVVEQLSQMQNNATTTLSAMSPSEEIMAQMNNEQTTTLNNLKQQVEGQVGILGDMSKNAFEFVNKWQQGGERLSALNDGINTGELPADAEGTIQELKKILDTGKTNIEDWSDQVDTAKEVLNTATKGYTSLMESFSTTAVQ